MHNGIKSFLLYKSYILMKTFNEYAQPLLMELILNSLNFTIKRYLYIRRVYNIIWRIFLSLKQTFLSLCLVLVLI